MKKNIVISLEKLSKKYLIPDSGATGDRYHSLRESSVKGVSNFFIKSFHIIKNPSNYKNKRSNEFWALNDVSLEIKEGERVGIIGHNGAGKSTLLKILSRVTQPTKGLVRMRGKVASLLEVGTGFHPELTGRENIFLNGAILGMSRGEIGRKLDQIVEFAEIEQFLDTPVKRYSSGMYVRLAFSVAAHLDSDILILDEVLAVGDSKFQSKCIQRTEDAALREGKTILMVSHNLQSVATLCSRAILMERGKVIGSGIVGEMIDKYLKQKSINYDLSARRDRVGTGYSRITRIEFEQNISEGEGKASSICPSSPTKIYIDIESISTVIDKNLRLLLIITDKVGNRIIPLNSDWVNPRLKVCHIFQRYVFEIPSGLHLIPNTYNITAGVAIDGIAADKIERAVEFDVVARKDYFLTGVMPSADMGTILQTFTCLPLSD